MLTASPPFITKVLLPQRRADTLRRPRLTDFLHQHIDRRLILVCAPAGYGKTTLLVDFAHDVDIPVCWYTLGPGDADVRVFLEYLIAAIRQRFPAFGLQTEAVLRGAADVTKELSAVVGALVTEMHAAIPEYFILALDDFHTVDNSEQVNSVLDLLLYYLPENCHVVVASRSIPRLTLSRLAAHRQVAGLGNSDLRFTADEIRRLLSENYKVLLPAKTAEALAMESEGWITGIILSTHTMWQGLFESIIRAKGAGGEVFDYLAGEVFAQQPEDVQRFLLGSSVLEQLHPQLCAALLDAEDAAAKLAYLEEANLFITRLAGTDDWYRYHQLFRAFLESKLRQEQPDWHASLQRRAGSHAVARAAWDEAIAHYDRGGDYDSAADLIIARAAEMIDTGKLITLARWIDALPAEFITARPELLLVRGRICLKSGEPDRGLELLNQAYGHFAEKGDPLKTARVLATRSVGLTIKGRYGEAVADCQRALTLAGADDPALAADVYRNLGICHGLQGHFPESIAALDEALRLQREGDDLYGVGNLHQSLGVANARHGNVPQARFHFDQALAIWRRLGSAGALSQTLNSLGVLLFHDGEYEAALATLTDALAKAREGNYLRSEAAVLADIGDVHRARQRYGDAIEAYERGLEIARRIEEGYFVGYALNGLGDTYARMGEFRRADRFIRQAIIQAEERQSPYERGMYETSLGILRCDQDEPSKGLRSLVRACDLLRQSGANRELTRALLGRARALHLLGRTTEAMTQLQSALALGAEIDYEQFLVLDGKRNEAVLAAARDRGNADPRLAAALQALAASELQPSPAAEAPSLHAIAKPRPAPLHALALGQARVLRDGKEITRSGWASDKVRELFFFLLTHPYNLHKDQIVESLWPDLPPGSYNSTFHSTMYRLRRALQGDYILQREGRYRLSPDVECYYDVAEFERLLAEAERLPRDSDEAAELCRRALAIYEGPFLKEYDTEWCEARRRQLAAKHLSALARLAALAAADAQYGESIALCEQALAADNFREEVHYLLIKCYVAVGDTAAALRHYRRYASFMRSEMGVDPSPKMRALYEQILKGARTPLAPRPVTR